MPARSYPACGGRRRVKRLNIKIKNKYLKPQTSNFEISMFFFCYYQKKIIHKTPGGVCKNHLNEYPSAF
jgi:hypothetical protein